MATGTCTRASRRTPSTIQLRGAGSAPRASAVKSPNDKIAGNTLRHVARIRNVQNTPRGSRRCTQPASRRQSDAPPVGPRVDQPDFPRLRRSIRTPAAHPEFPVKPRSRKGVRARVDGRMAADSSAPEIAVQSRILVLRGQRVLPDHDLASLYHVTTRRLNEQVSRNSGRFPADFCFQLSPEEVAKLRSQFAASSRGHGGKRHLPFAFSEHGALMAAQVLRSSEAVGMSVHVVRRLRAPAANAHQS